ncbi:MAG: NIPSNAP family protein [Pseudomonadota bacterium]|nr:NIPSNAP family protein [Pseudomonadota bacterium]
MIVEMRRYVLKPGCVGKYYELYDGAPRELQQRILGDLVGFYDTEIGGMNQLIHLWRYSSFEDRKDRRERLFKEPVWQDFAKNVIPLIETQETSLLNPAPFSD